VVEIPTLLHVHDTNAGTVTTRELPRIAGIDSARGSVKKALIPAARVVSGIHRRRWPFVERMSAVDLVQIVEPMDQSESIFGQTWLRLSRLGLGLGLGIFLCGGGAAWRPRQDLIPQVKIRSHEGRV